MDTQRTMDLGKQFTEALHAVDQHAEGSIEAMVELYSPDARLTNASLKLANEERNGHEGVRAFWTNYQKNFREASTEFFQVTSNEEAAGLFWTTRGTDSTGQEFEYDGVSLLVFGEDGKITLFRGYFDTRELTRKVSV